MQPILKFCAMLEGAIGLALFVVPGIVTRLLFGAEVDGVGLAVSRVGGLGLLSLGTACWPPREGVDAAQCAVCGILGYNILVALYLAWLGVGGAHRGIFLWPAVVLHATLTALLVRAMRYRKIGRKTSHETPAKETA
jgi:hypothetical protein